jgi:predicted GNAT superfamily acetyltransferase
VAPDDTLSVTVPSDYQELRARDPGAAQAARDETAAALETHLGEGRVAVGFDRDRSAYVLAPEPGRARDGAGR